MSPDPTLRMTSPRITVSGVRGPAHVLYAASWLRPLLESCDTGVTLVDLDGRLHHHELWAEILVRRLQESGSVSLVERHPSANGEHFYIAVGAPGVKPWLSLRASRETASFRTVVVDEGIGSYGGWLARHEALRREGGREPIALARATSVTLARRVLTDVRWPLYERLAGRWHVHEAAAEEFRRDDPGLRGSDRVVYLTHPWVEMGLIPTDAYLRHLRRLARALSDTGLGLLIRPHPLERLSKFESFDVISSHEPAESDPDVLSSHAVIGEVSTALLNVAALNGVRALRVELPPGETSAIRLSRDQRSLLDTFLPAPIDPSDVGAVLNSA